MRALAQPLIESAIAQLKSEGVLAEDFNPKIALDRTRDSSHGDFASNIAMVR